jgi:hypothetical protein
MKAGYLFIHRKHQKYLGFSWPDPVGKLKYYIFKGLSFGLDLAPYIFTKVFRVLGCYWRSKGVWPYIWRMDGYGRRPLWSANVILLLLLLLGRVLECT